MKKIKNTRYAYIGNSYTPVRDAKWEELRKRREELDRKYEELYKKLMENK